MDRLATKNCVKELDFDIKRLDAKEDWYSLPGTVFTAKSLMVLRLRGLKLKWPLIVNHINLSKLKELSLTDVFLEEWIILEICSACPEIEDLRLIRFQGVKDLLTSDLPNLLKLTIEQPSQTSQPHTSIQIRAVFLHTLYFSGCNNTVKFDFLRENLMDREVVPACCDSRSVKFWRHYLKEIEVKNSMNHLYEDFSPSHGFKPILRINVAKRSIEGLVNSSEPLPPRWVVDDDFSDYENNDDQPINTKNNPIHMEEVSSKSQDDEEDRGTGSQPGYSFNDGANFYLDQTFADKKELKMLLDTAAVRNINIANAFSHVYSRAHYGLCIRHLVKNLHVNQHCVEHLYLFYTAEKTYTVDEFSEHFSKLKNNSPEAAHVLENVLGFEKSE
ncbi:hypothetical protein FXO38_18572 [Capsicum annuum]|nr:hypothetical protein FXO38_18572 [Capsicum annuum]KAF3679185.1 hypothetical protein FXO37_03995 [Capsicum annuum]